MKKASVSRAVNKKTGSVLDTSALLAYLHGEPGADRVGEILEQTSVMSVVNWAETLSWFTARDQNPVTIIQTLEAKGLLGGLLEILPMTEEDALNIARLRPLTKAYGLSLGDRACLSLGLKLSVPVLTADRVWAELQVGVEVLLAR